MDLIVISGPEQRREKGRFGCETSTHLTTTRFNPVRRNHHEFQTGYLNKVHLHVLPYPGQLPVSSMGPFWTCERSSTVRRAALGVRLTPTLQNPDSTSYEQKKTQSNPANKPKSNHLFCHAQGHCQLVLFPLPPRGGGGS